MKKRILVIEDNPDVRENVAEILELADYEVRTAVNGKDGVDKVREAQPDLIICDVMMPELDGHGVLHILSKQSRTAAIPFIFLTAKAEKEDFRTGMNLGADDYMTKPFKELDLLNTIENRLAKVEKLRKTQSTSPSEKVDHFFSEVKAQSKLKDLTEANEKRSFPAKQILFSEGTNAHHIFYVLSGKVKLYKSNDMGKEFITDMVSPGEFLGQFAILENRPYKMNAVATEDCEIVQIPKTDFLSLIHTDRDVANQFIIMLANEVEEKAEKLIKLAYNSVRQRVADALLGIYEKESKGEFHISREDLANLTGTSKETVIRTLSDFKEEKLIRIDQNLIHVLSPQGLSSIIA